MWVKSEYSKLLIIVLLLNIQGLCASRNNEPVFIVAEEYCVTNGPSGIAFNPPVNETDENLISVSKFFPKESSMAESIDCRIEEGERCSSELSSNPDWKLENSIDGPIKQLITDRRWEELPQYKTKFVDDNDSLEFKNIFSFNFSKSDTANTFIIPFSVRVKAESHIFLCEDQVVNSRCYWVMLGAWKGNGSAIRICDSGNIPGQDKIWPEEPCKTPKVKVEMENIVSEKIWSHFKIVKKDGSIYLKKNNNLVLQTKDNDNPISPKHVFVHTKYNEGLWKLHKYTYIHTTEESSLQLKGPIRITTGFHCISFFAIMCSKCKLRIRIQNVQTNRELNSTDYTTSNEKWSEIKHHYRVPINDSVRIFLFTIDDGAHNPFWAIDNIRQCQEDEYRVLKSSKPNMPCQMIKNKTVITADNSPVTDLSEDCPEYTFGENCIPCMAVGDYFCQNFKYCEFRLGRKSACHCTSGYTGNNCRNVCSSGWFGHDCKKKCSYCQTRCSNYNGNCGGNCIKDFTGQKCDIPPATFFKYPPQVIEIKPTSCKVYKDNFEIVDGMDNPQHFKYQYKNINSSDWEEAGDEYDFHMKYYTRYTKLKNLEPESSYCVRAVIYSDGDYIYQGSAIEETCFKTPCIRINSKDITITTTDISAIITIKKAEEMCKLYEYKYKTNLESEYRPMENVISDGDDYKFSLPNVLRPNEKYEFYLQYKGEKDVTIRKTFTTKEGIPSRVNNLRYKSATTTTIELSWDKPSNPNGEVTYFIEYMVVDTLNCPNLKTLNNSFNSAWETATLKMLKPYTEYEIRVFAQTSRGRGNYSSIKVKTDSLDEVTEKEVPYVQNVSTYASQIEIKLKPINCEDISGPIFLKFQTKCNSEWCDKEQPITNITEYSVNATSYMMMTLKPNTEYLSVMYTSRKGRANTWRETGKYYFKTKPSVPHTIDKPSVTSKDEYSISFRWKPPFPPTGNLSKYKIKYNSIECEQNITKCKLWPEYHCATIRNDIKERTYYNIQFFAKNEVPNKYTEISTVFSVLTQTQPPLPPYDVMGNWTDNGDLKISWKHPNSTGGQLDAFYIIMNGSVFTKHIKSEEDYNLTYTYEIPSDAIRVCSSIDVALMSSNKKYNSTYYNNIEARSPPPPVPDWNIRTTCTNDTVIIDILNSTANSSTELHVLIPSSKNKNKVKNEINAYENALKNNLQLPTSTNIKIETYRMNSTKYIIGFNAQNDDYRNLISELGKELRIYLIFVNKCNGKVRLKQIIKNPFAIDPTIPMEKESGSGNGGLYALILLILLLPLIAYIYIYKIRRKENSTGNLLSAIKKQNKDIEEVPLSENKPTRTNVKRTPTKQKAVLSVPTLKTHHSKPVKIADFELYIKRSIETGELEEQHSLFPRGQTKPWDYGALKVNKSKNRYNNLVAYDHTRVVLAKIKGDEYSDYINANYIDGYRVSKAYIATQGPKATTLNDFWKMVWQENVKHIVMLANIYEGGKKKVEQYWPNINEEKKFNGITVHYVSSKVYANYEHRVFKVSKGKEDREVTQLHFTTWPDHGVPLYSQSLVPFLQQMLKIPNNSQSPVLVHCSAGVGRTGTIILCDISLRMAAGEGSLDFLANLEHLRSQRPNMVDNVEQYKLAHLVVLECLFGMHTSITCDDNINDAVDKLIAGDGIDNQIKYLTETEWQDRAMDTVWDNKDVLVYPEKNRFQDIIPDKNYRICIKCYPYNDESTSYINAVQVDGFRSPGRFIVTQQPLPNTIGDFWRMVWERQCIVIISLNEISPNDKTSCYFWPENNLEMSPVDYLAIRHVDTKELECFQIVTVQITNKKENECMEVNILALKKWTPNNLLPSSVQDLLLFWEECEVLSRKSETVIVTCHDGATASGLYVAATFVIDKIKLEQECDVCLAVRTIRHNRRQFVTSREQFEFLYRVAVMYLDGFQSYANFA